MIDPNAPAHPTWDFSTAERVETSPGVWEWRNASVKPGLTIRAYFASAAMQGLLIVPANFEPLAPRELTELACKYADALIAHLNETEARR